MSTRSYMDFLELVPDSNPSSPDEDPDIVPASQEEMPPMARRPLDVLRFSPTDRNIFKIMETLEKMQKPKDQKFELTNKEWKREVGEIGKSAFGRDIFDPDMIFFDEVNELVEMLIGRQMTPKERKEVKTVTKIQFASIWRPLLKKRFHSSEEKSSIRLGRKLFRGHCDSTRDNQDSRRYRISLISYMMQVKVEGNIGKEFWDSVRECETKILALSYERQREFFLKHK